MFQLTDKAGRKLNSNFPVIGNLIRISLPAPGNRDGGGYDWVIIEDFLHKVDPVNDEEQYGFRVRPVANPVSREKSSAHFYSREATSTFLLSRKGNIVLAMEQGRNEKPNLSAGDILSKIRNLFVAIGAMWGMAKPQWKSLMNGILKGRSEMHG